MLLKERNAVVNEGKTIKLEIKIKKLSNIMLLTISGNLNFQVFRTLFSYGTITSKLLQQLFFDVYQETFSFLTFPACF